MKYIISTLGCKVNQYETQAMEEILKQRGHSAVEDSCADVIIVNTCAVTAESGRKCRQTIRAMQDKNPNAMLAVCGCYAQVAPDVMEELNRKVEENIKNNAVVISLGCSVLEQGDQQLRDVFERADQMMYERKKELKAMGAPTSRP